MNKVPETTKVKWPQLKPKHIFLMSYGDIIREAGSLIHASSIRPECKNGQLKRSAVKGNNFKNIKFTMMRSENEAQAVHSYKGAYLEPELTVGLDSVISNQDLMSYVENNFSSCNGHFADTITYRGTLYSNQNHQTVLYYNKDKSSFEIGLIHKIFVRNISESNQEILLIHQKYEKNFCSQFGIYRAKPTKIFSHTCITQIADFYPLYLFQVDSSTNNVPELYLSLRQSPLIE